MTEDLIALDLKPCPFCGSNNVEGLSYRVKCINCYALGPWNDVAWQAVTAWNTRHESEALSAEKAKREEAEAELVDLEKLREKLDGLAYYEVGGVPFEWEHRARAAERKLYDYGHSDWYCGGTLKGSYQSTPTYWELKARAEAAEAALAVLQGEAREVVKPFAVWGALATAQGDGGAVWNGLGTERDRIVDWFGPSDFRRAAAFITKLETKG